MSCMLCHSRKSRPDTPPNGLVLSPVAMQDQLEHLEQEQEQLNSSLLALTTHFAQVQFRLKQIVHAPIEEKELLLKDLEQFAFEGCPDVRGSTSQDAQMLENMSEKEHEQKMMQQREKQMELIKQLKKQLDDLEEFAYEEGSGEIPQRKLMDKQGVIIDQLRDKLELPIEDLDSLSVDDLRRMVDQAVGRIVNPAKVKEQVIGQLKQQIGDLERFISFLQGEVTTPGPMGDQACSCKLQQKGNHLLPLDEQSTSETNSETPCCTHPPSPEKSTPMTEKEHQRVTDSNLSAAKKMLRVLQYLAIHQLGCGTSKMKERLPKKERNIDYYDMLKKLDRAVNHVIELVERHKEEPLEHIDYSSDASDSPITSRSLDEITIAVRKELAPVLRDLFEHGLMKHTTSQALMTPLTTCLMPRTTPTPKRIHIWDVFLKYYDIKNGKLYTSSPARKLSQAFDLDIVGGTAITSKQTLLAAIDLIHTTHDPLKRSVDSQFKAFVCKALNEQKLTSWCRLICRTLSIIDHYYYSWSYIVKTNFDGALQLLDKLSEINFNLPADLAVRHFTNIRDAF
ncbi:RUN domain-containing protein 1-like isoform X2 [Anneissia japonica]|uniref:RUN domain-containing protein 1-like isoform X2 n=1 Tax=Anneissia japonica TaxID=1529436 RepID=UPI0014258370|nr:RUN domain-containing protein 1-like isoform X2 [Anneissia japonica]